MKGGPHEKLHGGTLNEWGATALAQHAREVVGRYTHSPAERLDRRPPRQRAPAAARLGRGRHVHVHVQRAVREGRGQQPGARAGRFVEESYASTGMRGRPPRVEVKP